MYHNYNLEQKHECIEDVYQDFCCGAIRKKHRVFDSPLALQIQIAIDDFEPCDALKSKAGNQKTFGIYFEIRNIPPEFRSKLDARFLIALIKSCDLKEEEDSFDVGANQIVNEFHTLERDGIQINTSLNIKGGSIYLMTILEETHFLDLYSVSTHIIIAEFVSFVNLTVKKKCVKSKISCELLTHIRRTEVL